MLYRGILRSIDTSSTRQYCDYRYARARCLWKKNSDDDTEVSTKRRPRLGDALMAISTTAEEGRVGHLCSVHYLCHNNNDLLQENGVVVTSNNEDESSLRVSKSREICWHIPTLEDVPRVAIPLNSESSAKHTVARKIAKGDTEYAEIRTMGRRVATSVQLAVVSKLPQSNTASGDPSTGSSGEGAAAAVTSTAAERLLNARERIELMSLRQRVSSLVRGLHVCTRARVSLPIFGGCSSSSSSSSSGDRRREGGGCHRIRSPEDGSSLEARVLDTVPPSNPSNVVYVGPSTVVTVVETRIDSESRDRRRLGGSSRNAHNSGFSSNVRRTEEEPKGSRNIARPLSPVVHNLAGSLVEVAETIAELLVLPTTRADLVRSCGMSEMFPRGVLLTGPAGVGKTEAVRAAVAIADMRSSSRVHLSVVECGSTPDGVGGGSNDASIVAYLTSVFSEARRRAARNGTSVVLLCENIDVLCPSRERHDASASVSRRVALMLTLLDGFEKVEGNEEEEDNDDEERTRTRAGNARRRDAAASTITKRGRVLVVGTTRNANDIDEALRRPGRLDLEIPIAPPSPKDRFEILRMYCQRTRLFSRIKIEALEEFASKRCVGYVGADLKSLVREACTLSTSRSVEIEDGIDLLERAACNVSGSLRRGRHTVVPPSTKWSEIGGLGDIKLRMQQAVEWPMTHADVFRKFGLRPTRGVLLYGPPGCSKTTLVRAAASASGATLLCLNGADVYSPYVGESEAILRRAFARARAALPAILFLDEIDTLVGRRESGSDGGNQVQQRIITTLLTEMDGVDSADGLVVVGATNRPDLIDEALKRPGRFDRMLYVPPPESPQQCYEILRVHTKRMALGEEKGEEDVEAMLREVAKRCYECELTGAEIRGVCQRAALAALREDVRATRVRTAHFLDAIRAETTLASSARGSMGWGDDGRSGGGGSGDSGGAKKGARVRFAWYEALRKGMRTGGGAA